MHNMYPARKDLNKARGAYPYREIRGERRVEALRACHRLDRALGEVGVDAGAELRRIEERILGAEPA